jgi:hypothetical protein
VACDVWWLGTASDAWADPGNWVDANGSTRTPGPNDDVCITTGRNLPVVHSGGSSAAASIFAAGTEVLHVTGGTLDVGAVDLRGGVSLLGGTLSGGSVSIDALTWTAGTLTAASGSTRALTVSGDDPKHLSGDLMVMGVSDVSGAGLEFHDGAEIINLGWLTLSGGADLTAPTGAALLTNHGELVVTGTVGQTSTVTDLDNAGGRVTVSTARLEVQGSLANLDDGALDGEWAVTGTLAMPGAVSTLAGQLTLQGDGRLQTGADDALGRLTTVTGALTLVSNAAVSTQEPLTLGGRWTSGRAPCWSALPSPSPAARRGWVPRASCARLPRRLPAAC